MSHARCWTDLGRALRVYVLTDRVLARGRSETDIARAALDGGATAIQLRWKQGSLAEAIAVGRAVRTVCRQHGALFIVNDRVDLALAVNADGVHLGEDDLPVAEARRLTGPDLVIGYSPSSVADADRAARDGADYLGVGPVFGTRTKPDAGEAIGLDGLRRMVAAVSIPVVGIGGITGANAAAVIGAGACGVAVISAVVGADDVAAAARELRVAVDHAGGDSE